MSAWSFYLDMLKFLWKTIRIFSVASSGIEAWVEIGTIYNSVKLVIYILQMQLMLCKTCKQNTTGCYACVDFKGFGSRFSDACALYQQSFWEFFKVSSKKASTLLIFEVIKKCVAIQRSAKKACAAVLQINRKSSCSCWCLKVFWPVSAPFLNHLMRLLSVSRPPV